jgi:hypothetical protein
VLLTKYNWSEQMEKTVIEEAIGAQARGQKGVYDFSGET